MSNVELKKKLGKKTYKTPEQDGGVRDGNGSIMGDKAIPVRVAVRIRPLSRKESDDGCVSAIKVIPGRPQVFMSSMDRAYTYDYAFDDNICQDEVYREAVRGMIPKLFEGYNATVLAYGQTGSGKTYSMGTAYNSFETKKEVAGVIPRAVGEIFEEIERRAEEVFNKLCTL